MTATRQRGRYRIGDRVEIDMGNRRLTGFVVEDLGGVGMNGRRMLEIELPMDPHEPMRLTIPEEEIVGPANGEGLEPLSSDEIVEYLVNGGLIAILRSNLGGGKNQPKAWLCRNQLGSVTHTFLPERGLVGGEPVPFFAIHDSKVFTPKEEVVRTFIESFGLSAAEAKRVLGEVGTAPQ